MHSVNVESVTSTHDASGHQVHFVNENQRHNAPIKGQDGDDDHNKIVPGDQKHTGIHAQKVNNSQVQSVANKKTDSYEVPSKLVQKHHRCCLLPRQMLRGENS